MNPAAEKFFDDNPDAAYWYATSSIRIPNPRLRRDPLWRPEPWPDHHAIMNLDGCDCQ